MSDGKQNSKLEPKPVSATKVEMNEIVLPNDANLLGNILGGKVMHLIDIACAITAHRHCRGAVVTAGMDNLVFKHPVKIGELMTIKASVNRAFRTSMECGAKVISEDLETGKLKHTSSAYLTFVALGEDGRPVEVPEVIPETDEEKRRWEAAEVRRMFRIKQKALLNKSK